ncbi:unannotated protein [freshwater metagenome]|uniref:Unannotated protein n=1 Tax=freshwater metagenome TaxID=449393 RepID=A0A6J7XSR3_9ZZZZ|nr:type II secretion system protein F [Actinomycetota bacterium]
MKNLFFHVHARSIFFGSAIGLAVFLGTRSVVIATPFALLIGVGYWSFQRSRRSRLEGLLSQAWPEVIDHLISGISSGLSLAESLSGLATRGPEIVRPAFVRFRDQLRMDGNFSEGIEELKIHFAHHGSDQIFESISLAKSLGGSELMAILRTVGDFIRQDLTLRKEIEIKHGWIKNSAHLSSAAPWLLLLLLSTQPGTIKAYSTTTGIVILCAGLLMTALAYLWMERLGRLPQTPRVFGGK